MLSAAGAKRYQDLKLPVSTTVRKESEKKGEWVLVDSITQTEEGGTITVESNQKEKIVSNPDKLRLAYDKPLARTLAHKFAVGQFIFPSGTSGPAENIYEVSHFLESLVSCLSVRRSATRAEMWDYPLAPGHFNREDRLYDIIRI